MNLCKLDELTSAFAALIPGWTIRVNTNLAPATEQKQGVAWYKRIPFKLIEAGAETMEASFQFYIPCTSEAVKMQMLNELTKLCGYKQFNLYGTPIGSTTPTTFTVTAWLDFFQPDGAPVYDIDEYTQAVTISGTVTVTDALHGLMMDHAWQTLMRAKTGANTWTDAQTMQITKRVASVVYETEAPHMEAEASAKALNRSIAYTWQLTILCTNSGTGEALAKMAYGFRRPGVNETVKIVDKFGGTTYAEKEYLITGISLEAASGAFTTVVLTLQDPLT